MKAKLEVLANLMIVITAVVVLTTVVFGFGRQKFSAPPEYKIGDNIGKLPIDFGKEPQTLMFVVNSQCHFCEQSIPFLQIASGRSNFSPKDTDGGSRSRTSRHTKEVHRRQWSNV
jgi:hypothetical protein